MSYSFLPDVLFHQRFLKAGGFYTGKLDGIWGHKTDAAEKAFEQQTKTIAAQEGGFDARSEGNIITLAPKAQTTARRFLAACKNLKKDVRLISGTRTYEEQDALYAQGRTLPGSVVTNAKGGQSNHNFGIAWDIGIFSYGNYITEDRAYINLAAKVLPSLPGIEWGGSWNTFKDYPHYQLKAVSDDLAVVRNDFETGKMYV